MLCGIELRYSTLLAHVHLGWNMEEGIDWHIRLVQKEVSTIGVCFSALDFSGEMDFFSYKLAYLASKSVVCFRLLTRLSHYLQVLLKIFLPPL